MSATDLALVVITGAALVTVGLVVWLVIELRRTAEQLRDAVERVRSTVEASTERAAAQGDAIDHELRRANGLLDTAERVSARADTLSKVTYGAVARPVIKTAAVVKGTGRAARRLRRGADDVGSDTG